MDLFKKIFGKKTGKSFQSDSDVHNNLNAEKAFQKALNTLNQYKRTAYIPVTKISESIYSVHSKIGGLPYLRNKYDWPVCPNCQKNMQLFVQLNLEELPTQKEKGLIQLFYCTSTKPHCETDLEAFFPYSKAVVCRKVDITVPPVRVQPNIDLLFQDKLIVDWTAKDDYPHFEEYSELGIELDLSDDVYTLMELHEIGLPLEKDKLFGWPSWVQSVEYPRDRKTSTQMELFFQLDSEDNLPYMFGDCGIGHLTQSPDHSNELAFGWACC